MKRLKSKERSGVLHEYLGDGSGSIETAMLPSFRRGGLKKSGF